MIDLTGIFTLWCFHNVKNSIPNNVYGYKSSKTFLGFVIYSIFAPINKKKYGIDIGSTIRYSNLIFRKNEYYSFHKIRPNTESSILFGDQLFERTNSSNYLF